MTPTTRAARSRPGSSIPFWSSNTERSARRRPTNSLSDAPTGSSRRRRRQITSSPRSVLIINGGEDSRPSDPQAVSMDRGRRRDQYGARGYALRPCHKWEAGDGRSDLVVSASLTLLHVRHNRNVGRLGRQGGVRQGGIFGSDQ